MMTDVEACRVHKQRRVECQSILAFIYQVLFFYKSRDTKIYQGVEGQESAHAASLDQTKARKRREDDRSMREIRDTRCD